MKMDPDPLASSEPITHKMRYLAQRAARSSFCTLRGAPTVFADGFAAFDSSKPNPGPAKYRPVGAAVGPDGSLYIADSQKGRVWRISYDGSASGKK